MDVEKAALKLGIEKWRLKGALERRNAYYVESFHPPYLLLKKEISGLERGTALFLGSKGEVIRGFPKILRAFYLDPLLKRHFAEEVAVEEKLNGYNVRACSVEGKLLALTRGGFVCPYTTSRLREDENLKSFLEENPNLVACGEVVGEENPYVAHRYPEAEDFGFFCFDLREKGTGNPLGVDEKRKLCQDNGIAQVPLLGVYERGEATSRVIEGVKRLAQEGREGVVIKDPRMEIPPVKYTPSSTNASDLAYAFRFPYEYGKDFLFSRVIREGYQAVEWGEGEKELEERAARLGKSIICPMVESIREVKDSEGMLTEDYTVRVKSRGEIRELSSFLNRQGIDFTLEEVGREDEGTVYRLQKLRHSTTDKIRSVLKGKGK